MMWREISHFFEPSFRYLSINSSMTSFFFRPPYCSMTLMLIFFDFSTRIIDACKHIYAVKFWIATNTYFKPKPKVADSIPCDGCGSINVMKYGFSADKQVFKCKDCQHKFREESLLKKAKFTPELI